MAIYLHRRNKVMNYFSLMFRKRMRGDEAADDADEDSDKKTKGKAKKGMSKDRYLPKK